MDWVLFLHRIKDFVSENNGFWIHKLCVNLTFIVKWRSFPWNSVTVSCFLNRIGNLSNMKQSRKSSTKLLKFS